MDRPTVGIFCKTVRRLLRERLFSNGAAEWKHAEKSPVRLLGCDHAAVVPCKPRRMGDRSRLADGRLGRRCAVPHAVRAVPHAGRAALGALGDAISTDAVLVAQPLPGPGRLRLCRVFQDASRRPELIRRGHARNHRPVRAVVGTRGRVFAGARSLGNSMAHRPSPPRFARRHVPHLRLRFARHARPMPGVWRDGFSFRESWRISGGPAASAASYSPAAARTSPIATSRYAPCVSVAIFFNCGARSGCARVTQYTLALELAAERIFITCG
jgi:hypothetical protein